MGGGVTVKQSRLLTSFAIPQLHCLFLSVTMDSETIDGISLSREMVSAGLGELGLDPFSQAHVFTTATLSQLSLSDLDAIRGFPHVQHVVCSQNRLRSLDALQYLPVLLSLDASDNELTQVLGYEVPKCTRERAWSGGERWIGSLLRHADLSGNRITQLPQSLASSHPFLLELRLARNEITRLVGVAHLRFLRVLDLSYNKLSSTRGLIELDPSPNADDESRSEQPLPALHTLLLSHNAISSIDGVAELPRLQHLDLSDNPLARLDQLQDCRSLQRLHLARSGVEDVNELNPLMDLPLLGELTLQGSPVAEGAVFFRARVLRRLRQLRVLDGELATAKEKVKARAMHGEESASRRAVAAKHMPSHEFVDFLPPVEFEDDAPLLERLAASRVA